MHVTLTDSGDANSTGFHGGRASSPREGSQRCSLWTRAGKLPHAVKTRERRFLRLFKAHLFSPDESRRGTSGYLLTGVCRRRAGNRFHLTETSSSDMRRICGDSLTGIFFRA